MHLNNYEHRNLLLIDWVISNVPSSANILDIGASDGSFCPEIRILKERGNVIDGVDPDAEALARNPLLRHRYTGKLEDAAVPAESFDAAFAIYVAEHVEDPDAFLAAAARALKPGGALFLITPNGDHYFARIAKVLDQMRLQERVLRLLRPRDLVERYHHSAHYRMNRPAVIRRLAERHGFEGVELRFSERHEEVACYFPGLTKLFPRLWEWLVSRTGKEHLLGNMMVRLIKASGSDRAGEAGHVP